MRADTRSFEESFEAHADELFRHASLRLPSRELARDLTQDTFAKTWEYLVRGGEVRDIRSFLFRTLRNLIIDEYRRSKSDSLEALVDADEGETVDTLLPPDESNTLDAATARLDGARVLALVEKLPEPYREAVVFRYVEGLSPSEIANIISLSENVVSVRIHRGLKKLRELAEQLPPHTP